MGVIDAIAAAKLLVWKLQLRHGNCAILHDIIKKSKCHYARKAKKLARCRAPCKCVHCLIYFVLHF